MSLTSPFDTIVAQPTIYSSSNQKPAAHYNCSKPTCDRCGTINLDIYVGNMTVPDVDLCMTCFNALVKPTVGTPKNIVIDAAPKVILVPVATSVISSRDLRQKVPLEFELKTENKHARATSLRLFQIEGDEEKGIYKDYHDDLEWIRKNYRPVDVTQANVIFRLIDASMAREQVPEKVEQRVVEESKMTAK